MSKNGGDNGNNIDSSILAKIAENFFAYTMPFEGAADLFGRLAFTIMEEVTSRGTSSTVALPDAATVLLQRLIPEQKDLKNLDPYLEHLEELLLQSERTKNEAVVGLVGVRQLAKNTVWPAFLRVFGLQPIDPQEFLMEHGFDLSQAETIVQSQAARAIGIDMILLTLWSIVAHYAERDAEGRQPSLQDLGPEDREEEQLVPETSRRAQIPKASIPVTTRTTRTTLTAEQKTIAQLSKQVADLQAMVAALVGGKAAPAKEAQDDRKGDADSEDEDYMSEDDVVSVPGLNVKGESRVFDESPELVCPSVPTVTEKSAERAFKALKGPLLYSMLMRTRANFRLDTDLTFDELNFMLNSEVGFFMLGVDGVPVVMKPVTVNKYSTVAPLVSTALYNPDADSYLASLGLRQVSAHLYCASIAQFNCLMSDQLMKLMQPSPLFPASVDRNMLMRTLHQYQQKIQDRLGDLCGGDPSPQSMQRNKHHITLWTVLFVFHLNRWMRAMIHQDLSLLLRDFDAHWYSTYASKVRPYPGQRPEISLEGALSFLLYRCTHCYRLGACVHFCSTVNCLSNVKAVKTVGGAASVQPSAGSGYMAAYKAWCKAEGKPQCLESKTAFEKTDKFKARPDWSNKPKPAAAVATVLVTATDYYDQQDAIEQHFVPRMQYNP